MIKYRVYDTEQKRYLNINNVSISGSGILIVTNYEDGYYTSISQLPNENSPRFIIEQYTGLKDKNGVEIAVGDIVQYDLHFYGRRSTRNMVVEWIRDGETDLIGQPTFSGYLWQGCNYKVIGNIHDSAELLEAKDE